MKERIGIIAFIALLILSITTNVPAQWVPIGLQGSEAVSLITNANYVFAGVYGGGVFRSDDSGATWTQINTGLVNRNIVVLGGNTSMIFAATDTSGIFISTNNGGNWNALSGWKRKDAIKQFAFLGTDIFIATDSNGVFRSQDGGMNFVAINNGLSSLQILGIIANGTNLFINTLKAKVFRSTDNGNSWINASQGLPSFGIDILFQRDSTLFGANKYGLYHSINGGRTWINPDKADTPRFSVSFAVANDNGVILNASYRTIDYGLTWIPIKLNTNSVLRYYGIWSMVSIGNVVLVGTALFVTRSTDYGVTWPDLYTDTPPFGPGTGNDVFTFTKIGSTLYAGTEVGLLFSTDNGINWVPSKGLGRNAVYSFVHFGKNFFAGTDTGGIYISSDNTLDWSPLQGMSNSFPISSLVSSDSDLFASTIGAGIFKSTDNGKTWGLSNNTLKNTNIYSFEKFDKTLFAGSDTGRIYLSNDKGVHWLISDVGQNTLNFRGRVNAFAKKDTLLFSTRSQLSGGSAVFVSTDRGKTWTNYGNFGFEHDELSALLATDSGLFVGCFPTYYHSHSRLFRCIDDGVTWVNADDGYGGGTECLTLFDGYIYAGTSDGIWRRRLSDFITHVGRINTPNLFFDSVRVGDTVCKTIEIRNIGTAPFILKRSFVFYGDSSFTIDSSQFPILIKSGDSTTVTICFHPKVANYYSGTIQWATDIEAPFKNFGNAYTTLTGTGSYTLGIQAQLQFDSLSLSPNPTTGIITVHNIPQNLKSIAVMNVLGESLLEFANPHEDNFTFDLSKFVSGTYYVRFVTSNSVITKIIVRQ